MVLSRALSRTRIVLAISVSTVGAAALIASSALASSPPTTDAVPLPGPNQFVSGLDLECFDTPLPNSPLNTSVTLTELNPVLANIAPHNVVVRELQQTCVPVQKNGVPPQAAALPFIRHVDLACFRIEAPPLTAPIDLTLRHLNPVLLGMGLPAHKVQLLQAVQLCVPVTKNGVAPPPEVARLVQFIDLECWRVNPEAHHNFTVNLAQLNPQLGNIAPHDMTLVSQPRQLCVPVRKNNQLIPDDILNIVRWVDLEKFTASPIVTVPSVQVVLKHMNPLFANFPALTVKLERASALMVPVTKNGVNPPPP